MMASRPFASLIEKDRRRRAWYALGVNQTLRYCLLVGAPIIFVAVLVNTWNVGPDSGWEGGPALMVGGIAFFAPDRFLRRYRTRWIDMLELPLDRESYAVALDGATLYARLEIIVEGVDLKCPEITGIVAHLTEASPTRLVFESFTMQLRPPRAGVIEHNFELHLWFVLLTQRVLRPIARSQHIERITARHLEASHPAVTSARATQR